MQQCVPEVEGAHVDLGEEQMAEVETSEWEGAERNKTGVQGNV